MRVRVLRAPLKWARNTDATHVLEPLGDDSPVRTIYLEKKSFPSDVPDYVAVRVVVDESGAMGRFARFLDERVERGDKDAKVTVAQIWAAWAGIHGAAPDRREIEGIKLSDAPDLFRDRFGAEEMSRAKIDGKTRWCWRGYRIVDGGSKERARDSRTGA